MVVVCPCELMSVATRWRRCAARRSIAAHSTLLAAYTNWLKSREMRPVCCASKAWNVRAAPCGRRTGKHGGRHTRHVP